MYRTLPLLTATALVALAAHAAPASAQTTLDVMSWGGAYGESQRRAYLEPYEQQNEGVSFNFGDQSAQALSIVRSQVEAGNVTWDLVDMLQGDATLACDEGLIEEIDFDALAAAPDGTTAANDFIAGTYGDCFVPQILYATLFAYNTEAFPDGGPQTVADMFDLESFPGTRALQNIPDGNLEWALVADGVDPSEVYQVLSTDEGVERAFRKLDTIKDDVIFWEAGAQPPQLLADQEAVIATGFNGRFFNAAEVEDQPIEIVWDGQLFEVDGWVVPAGAPNMDETLEFLRFATDTQRLADQAQYISYAPARQSSIPLVGQHADLGFDMAPHMPTNPQNFKNPIQKDPDWWADNGDEMRELFNAWLAR